MRLPALEKNILVYRALQMTLFLFYAESVRRQLVESVGRSMRCIKGAKLIKRIFAELETQKILSPVESAELQSLLEHRNTIAHEVHRLTGDIEVPGRSYGFGRSLELKYDYSALKKIKGWHTKLDRTLGAQYILVISFDGLLFEAAERAYEKELAALRRRIERLYDIRLRNAKRPDQALEPTTSDVTIRADARLAPAAVVAHLSSEGIRLAKK
jgi:hypothetical protein